MDKITVSVATLVIAVSLFIIVALSFGMMRYGCTNSTGGSVAFPDTPQAVTVSKGTSAAHIDSVLTDVWRILQFADQAGAWSDSLKLVLREDAKQLTLETGWKFHAEFHAAYPIQQGDSP